MSWETLFTFKYLEGNEIQENTSNENTAAAEQ